MWNQKDLKEFKSERDRYCFSYNLLINQCLTENEEEQISLRSLIKSLSKVQTKLHLIEGQSEL